MNQPIVSFIYFQVTIEQQTATWTFNCTFAIDPLFKYTFFHHDTEGAGHLDYEIVYFIKITCSLVGLLNAELSSSILNITCIDLFLC